MIKLRGALSCVLLLVVIGLGVYAAGFVMAATVAVASLPTQADLNRQADALRTETLREIDKQADGLRAELHGDVRLLNGQISAVSRVLNQRVGDSLGRVDTALATVQGIRKDLQPVLASIPPAVASAGKASESTAALMQDGKDSLDDAYDDFRSLLDSSEVAVTQSAQTLETINKAAPAMAIAAQKNADSVAGITSDAHAMTTAMLKPKSVFGKIWAAITVASRFAGLL